MTNSSVAVFSYEVIGSDAPVIKAGSAKGRPGQTVNVTISLENNLGLVSMRLNVGYDKSALTLTNVTDAGILGNQCHSDDYELNPYVLYWDNGSVTQNYNSNGKAVTLTFKINDDAEKKDYPITISYNRENHEIFDVNLEPVEFDTISGKVTVADVICGDVDGNGTVTAIDNAILARYFAKWKGYDESKVDLSAADVNGDGRVTVLDNVILSRHIAKWKGYNNLPYAKDNDDSDSERKILKDCCVTVNGERVILETDPIQDGKEILMPIRTIAEKLNCNVEWDAEMNTVVIANSNVTVVLQVGNSKMYVNGNGVVLDAPAQIIDNRTMIPAKAVVQSLGGNVVYNSSSNSVEITY